MFTRGQIEWAVAQMTNRTSGLGEEPRVELKMKIKRLLDIDRKRGIDATTPFADLNQFAFMEGTLPGKGIAISYTDYDAFAVYLGLRLLDANVPQMAVIRLLRRIRPMLKREHDKILRQSVQGLAGARTNLEAKIKTGFLVKDPSRMIFLVLSSGAGADTLYQRGDEKTPANIVRTTDDLVTLVAKLALVSPPVLVFELINSAHQLAWWLDHAPTIRRGRP